MARLVLTGDNHIGKAIHLSPTRLAEQEQAWRQVLTAAREENVDAVLHAGDLFDARRPTPEVYVAAERPLVEHRDQGGPPVVMIVGNHCLSTTAENAAVDVLAEAGLIDLHREPDAVKVVDGTLAPLYTSGGVTVACLPWAPISRLRAQLGSEPSVDEINVACAELLVRVAQELRDSCDGPAILMAHWSVDAAVLPSGMSVADLREVVLPLAELEQLGFDAVVLAHIHRPQMLGEEMGELVFYTGSPMPLDFGEGEVEHGYWIIEIGDGPRGRGCAASFKPLDSPRFVTLTLDEALDEQINVDDVYVRVKDTAEDGIEAEDVQRAMLAAGALYAKVELETPRASRARVQALDETVSDERAFGLWLAAQDPPLDEPTIRALAELDSTYRAKVAV